MAQMNMVAGVKLLGASMPFLNLSRSHLVRWKHCSQTKLSSKNLTVTARHYSKDVAKMPPVEDDEKSRQKPEPTSHDTTQKMARVQYIDKKSLVWDKRYKSIDDVPEMLPYQTVVQARNRFRIRANLFMIGLTVLAALVMIYTGKERAKTGDSVEKRTIERHRQLRAQKAEEERLAQAAAEAEAVAK